MSQESNPASAPEKVSERRTRIPMSVPHQKLTVPDIPGFHLHWMLGTTERLAQAKRAGYVFVERGEVEVGEWGLASDPDGDGSSDMGSQISLVAGGLDGGGQPVRLVLMKLKQEWWDEDQKAREAQSDALIDSLRAGRIDATQAGEHQSDRQKRYVDAHRTSNMFTKRRA